MDDEPDIAPMLKLPFGQKDAWEWAFRAGIIAVYFWAVGHFVGRDEYEKHNEKEDAQRELIIKDFRSMNDTLIRIDEHMKNYDQNAADIATLRHEMEALQNYYHGKAP